MRWGFGVIACGALLVAARSEATEAKQESIAILDFGAQGVPEHVASIVTQNATAAIDRLRVFRVISSDDIKSMLTAETLQQMAGCGENSCLAELAGAIGATYIVSGSVGKIGSVYQISLTLINQERALTVDRVVRQDDVPIGELPVVAGTAARTVVQKLLEAHKGTLELLVGEPGADVSIDDRLVGVSPLSGALELPQGPHRVVIEKSGFVAFKQDVEVRRGETSGVRVDLVPSAEFREAYRARNSTLRWLAWLSTGLTVVGGGVYVGALVVNYQKAAEAMRMIEDSEIGGTEVEPVGLDPSSPAVARYNQLVADSWTSAVVSYVGLGTGVAAGVAAMVFWIVGEDPDRYDR